MGEGEEYAAGRGTLFGVIIDCPLAIDGAQIASEAMEIIAPISPRRCVALSTLITAALGFSVAGCNSSPFGSSMVCTTRGCLNQFTATVSVASSAVPAGTHTIDVTADGISLSCTFAFPPENGATVGAQCPIGLTVDVQPATVCTTTYTDAAKTERCDPVPGQFMELISVMGAPASVHVQQSVGGAVILDQSATPTYQSTQPNGPGCDPICQQAGADWAIP